MNNNLLKLYTYISNSTDNKLYKLQIEDIQIHLSIKVQDFSIRYDS